MPLKKRTPRHARSELPLYPPTWVTLDSLAEQRDTASLLAALRLRGAERFETAARRGPAGPMLLWEGDAEYAPDAADAASTARHRLEIGRLPWVYTRTD